MWAQCRLSLSYSTCETAMVTVLVASRTVPPLAISEYDLVLAWPLAARTASRAAVRVVLPWSMCPIVPTLTCGFVLVNVSFAMSSTPYGIPGGRLAGTRPAAPHVNGFRVRAV